MPALSHANAAATVAVVLAIVVAVAVVVLAIVVAVSVVVVDALLVVLVFPCLRQGPPRQDRPEIGVVAAMGVVVDSREGVVGSKLCPRITAMVVLAIVVTVSVVVVEVLLVALIFPCLRQGPPR